MNIWTHSIQSESTFEVKIKIQRNPRKDHLGTLQLLAKVLDNFVRGSILFDGKWMRISIFSCDMLARRVDENSAHQISLGNTHRNTHFKMEFTLCFSNAFRFSLNKFPRARKSRTSNMKIYANWPPSSNHQSLSSISKLI